MALYRQVASQFYLFVNMRLLHLISIVCRPMSVGHLQSALSKEFRGARPDSLPGLLISTTGSFLPVSVLRVYSSPRPGLCRLSWWLVKNWERICHISPLSDRSSGNFIIRWRGQLPVMLVQKKFRKWTRFEMEFSQVQYSFKTVRPPNTEATSIKFLLTQILRMPHSTNILIYTECSN